MQTDWLLAKLIGGAGETTMRRLQLLLLGAAVAALATQAWAQKLPLPPPDFKLDWVKLPTGMDIDRYYPDAAQRHNAGGSVVLGCNVQPDGQVYGCKSFAESPKGFGLGEAAIRMSGRLFQLKPGSFEHALPVPGRVAISISFTLTAGSHQRPPFVFGYDAALLTGGPLAQAATPLAGVGCFRAASAKVCNLHLVTWVKSPNSITAMVSILNAGKTDGSDVAVCAVGPDGALVNCTATSPEAGAVMADLVGSFKASSRADDGTPITTGPIAIVFDWKSLAAAAQALRPDPTLAASAK